MRIKKYKYYFKKPKSEITKDILLWLFVAGGVIRGGGSVISQLLFRRKSLQKYSKHNIENTFSYLRKRGFIIVEKHNHQINLSLTEEGKKKAGIFQLQDFKVSKPKQWDKKWRLLLFDIAEKKKNYREALRSMLKALSFYQLQKSVWVHAFDCGAEIELLKEFFGFTDEEVRLVIAQDIGETMSLERFFKFSE